MNNETINTLDIEAYAENQKFIPYCVGIFFKNKFIYFYGEEVIEKFLFWANKHKIKTTFYIHNLTFDGCLLIQKNTDKTLKFDGFIFNQTLYKLTIQNENCNMTFKCSFRLFPLSLYNISKLLEIEEKKNFPHWFASKATLFYEGKNPVDPKITNWKFKETAVDYCKHDNTITIQLIKKIQKILNNDSILKKSLSIAKLALLTFEEKWNKKNLNLKINTELDDYIRPAYRGGRCEVFGNPEELEFIVHFDFTGMYAQIMRENLPLGNYKIEYPKKIEKPGFYDVTITQNNSIPILPTNDLENKKLIFPNGTWRDKYWFEELLLFEEHGGKINQIHSATIFEEYEKVFEDFVIYFSQKRKEDVFSNMFWKLFINSITGRLGLRDREEKTSIINIKDYKTLDQKKIIKEIYINDLVIISEKTEKNTSKTKANVAISAAITSKARVKLYKAFMDVEKNGGRVLYTDTDSIFAAYKYNPINETHGEIFWDEKKNDTIIESAIFALPKAYALKTKNEDIIKIKGLKKNTTYEEFEECFKTDKPIKKLQDQIIKHTFEPGIIKLEKAIYLSSYDKRIFNEKKTHTTPKTIIQK